LKPKASADLMTLDVGQVPFWTKLLTARSTLLRRPSLTRIAREPESTRFVAPREPSTSTENVFLFRELAAGSDTAYPP
jgi:hypothetical protein